jgi:membrane protease YdiL (CAAX protease family)
MTADLRATLIKVAIPLLGMIIPLVVARLRGFDVREFAALRRPTARQFALWLGIWIVWMVLTELVLQTFHLEEPSHWRAYAPLIVALRILAIGLLGPIAEELIFRGVIYGRLAPKIGVPATIVSVAIVWGLIHLANGYAWTTIVLICIDGLLLGYARQKSGSVLVPMAMHSLANLYSIYQSLS